MGIQEAVIAASDFRSLRAPLAVVSEGGGCVLNVLLPASHGYLKPLSMRGQRCHLRLLAGFYG
jgi:hypothetical protein